MKNNVNLEIEKMAECIFSLTYNVDYIMFSRIKYMGCHGRPERSQGSLCIK